MSTHRVLVLWRPSLKHQEVTLLRARMGDCLWTGTPSRYVISHLGQLSLPSLRGSKSSARLRAGVEAGNAVWSHMAGDVPQLCYGSTIKRYSCLFTFIGAKFHDNRTFTFLEMRNYKEHRTNHSERTNKHA